MRNPELKKYGALVLGFIAIVLWITVFTAGININSSYYRAAVSYNYANWKDWLMTIVSFTLTNVILLAFLSGFLGGISSKVITTEGFTLSKQELKKQKHDNVLFENPIISAFRGVFLFIALLTFQYVSSFSDLSSIDKGSETASKQKDLNGIYYSMLDSVTDSASKKKLQGMLQKQQEQFRRTNNDTIVLNIRLLMDSIQKFPNDRKMGVWEEKVRGLRTEVQLPDLADIPGLSSSSYFRFAVIVSLLAFICGYDPNRFNSFLKMIPVLSKTEKNNQDDQSTNKEQGTGTGQSSAS